MALNVIGICPTVDFAFKATFGSPEHTRVTVHFLNSVLRLPSPITSVTIQNPFLGKDDDEDKLSVLDILAVDQNGRMINIEMQTTLPAGMNRRLLYHGARLYGGQLSEGDGYTALDPAIVICVLGKPMFPEAEELHLDFRLRDDSGRILTDDLQVHLLQLSKLAVTAQNVSNANLMEQWAFFMLNAQTMSMEEVRHLFPDDAFSEAAGVLEMIAKTPDQKLQYDARLKFQMDEAARLEQVRIEAQQEIQLARIEGLREGEAKGLREGEAKGLREGEARGLREGEAKGLQKGELLGRIRVFQELLGIDVPSADELFQYDESQLSDLANQLQNELRSRRQ